MARRALGVVLGLALGCGGPGPAEGPRPRPHEAAPAAPPAPAAIEAATEGVYVAVVVASEKADLGPMVAGEVLAVHVRPGDRVEAGQSLATLDARRAREDLRMTEATLRSEKAALEQAAVDRRETASRLAEQEQLARAGAASQGAVTDARFEHQRAQAAEARAAAVAAQWRTRRDQLERQLADTEIRAPFAGTVAARYIDPGGTAGPGAPIVRLLASDALWVRFAAPPGELGRLTVGTIVAAEIDGGVTVEATVRQVAPETDAASQLVFVDAELDLDRQQRPGVQVGASARVRLLAPAGG